MRALMSTAATGRGISDARSGAARREGFGRVVVTRAPIPALRPFVKLLWASDEASTRRLRGPARELVLPTGAMHLVVRLSGHPLRLYEHLDDPVGNVVGHAVVGGARAASAGGTVLREPVNQFYGERSGTVRDPFGHEWIIGHHIEDVAPKEMQRRYTEMLKGG